MFFCFVFVFFWRGCFKVQCFFFEGLGIAGLRVASGQTRNPKLCTNQSELDMLIQVRNLTEGLGFRVG